MQPRLKHATWHVTIRTYKTTGGALSLSLHSMVMMPITSHQLPDQAISTTPIWQYSLLLKYRVTFTITLTAYSALILLVGRHRVKYRVTFTVNLTAYSALILLVRRHEEHPVCKNWVMRCWCGYLSGVRCWLFAYGPADATASQNYHHLLPHLNPDCFAFLALAYPGCIRKEAIKRVY